MRFANPDVVASAAESSEAQASVSRGVAYKPMMSAALLSQLGVGGEQLIKRVLGHADGSVTAIYNRYGYVKEMRAVLEHWATELTADELNVMNFRAKAA